MPLAQGGHYAVTNSSGRDVSRHFENDLMSSQSDTTSYNPAASTKVCFTFREAPEVREYKLPVDTSALFFKRLRLVSFYCPAQAYALTPCSAYFTFTSKKTHQEATFQLSNTSANHHASFHTTNDTEFSRSLLVLIFF